MKTDETETGNQTKLYLICEQSVRYVIRRNRADDRVDTLNEQYHSERILETQTL